MALTSCRQRRLIFSLFVCSVLGSAHAAEPQEFPLPAYDDAICIPVEVAGKEKMFMLDSGASLVFVHESLKDHLGKSEGHHRTKDAEGHRVKLEFFEAPTLRIGETDWTCSEQVGCFDFSLFQVATGREIEGILGVPFFTTRIIQLDFDRRLIRILPADTPPEDDWGAAVPLEFDRVGVPRIALELPGVGKEMCEVDTGFVNDAFIGTLSLNRATCLKLEHHGAYSPLGERSIATLSGVQSVRYGTVSNVGLGGFEHHDLPVDCSKGEGRIGLGYLKRFRVTFDVGNKTAYFAKGERFDERVRPSIGFGGLRIRGKTVIGGVEQGSPAETAGLHGGDELIQVNGKSMNRLPTAEIDWKIRQLSEEGTKRVSLKIRRDGKVRELKLDLSAIYE